TRYIREHLKPGEVVAVTDAGQISYELPLDVHVLDMFGLTDAHIAHLKPQFPGGILGRGDGFGKWDVDYVLSRSPRFIQVQIKADEQGNLIATNTSNRLLIGDPRFKARCRMLPYPETFGLFECVW
ncbi:MAG: hypothetical protein RML99_11970, partial [Anaerolineae bacterium]|nr:hypothetical protein [Anaerolineae bacterium]